jgi:dTDP-4-amino-4,6-dideoxygalactose transaminase
VSKPVVPATRTYDKIPCFRPVISDEEIAAATAVLRSGWLTTGPKAREFEESSQPTWAKMLRLSR